MYRTKHIHLIFCLILTIVLTTAFIWISRSMASSDAGRTMYEGAAFVQEKNTWTI